MKGERKPNIFAALLLFLSANAPLFIMLIIKDFDFAQGRVKHPVAATTLFCIGLLSFIMVLIMVSQFQKSDMVVTIKKVRSRSMDMLSYILPYIFCIWDIDLEKTADVVIFIYFFLILFVLAIKTPSVYINPFLMFTGYTFYDVEYIYEGRCRATIVLTKYDIHKGDKVYFRSLTKFLYFAVKKQDQESNEAVVAQEA